MAVVGTNGDGDRKAFGTEQLHDQTDVDVLTRERSWASRGARVNDNAEEIGRLVTGFWEGWRGSKRRLETTWTHSSNDKAGHKFSGTGPSTAPWCTGARGEATLAS